MNIGFVGLGAMGLPMAKNLVAAGHQVAGCDVRAEPVRALAEAGGRSAASPAAAARGADILVLMVVNADQAEAVLYAADGAAPALDAGAVVIASCTQPAARARALASRLEEQGVLLLDAPVSGGVVGAEQGALSIMASGPDEAFDRAMPVLEVLGKAVWRMGSEPGLGSMMKTVNQLMCGAHIAVAAEAVSLAARAGLDAALAQDVLMAGAAGSWMLGNRGPRMLQAEPPVTSAVDIFVKDLDIVLDAGHDLRVALPMAAAAHQMFLGASGLGHGKEDDSQVLKAYENLSGIKVPRG
ncbi:NAD(P)-dependent oxidoreductase [Microbaculum marinum]|uniref:NAD(P)-dependent oxidoreductase n=1 Tax=Microbaculum marinum TaxID=1764581 RepID=A0AAW9RJB6_9HYPH